MSISRFGPLALSILAVTAFSSASAQEPGRSGGDSVRYPQVEGRNLLDEEFVIPEDLPGRHRLLLVPFHQWQQREVDSWLARLPGLTDEVPELTFFEVPTLNTRWTLMRWMIDGGMKSGIGDPAARARTITVYTDRRRFMRAAEIPDHDHITVVLLDETGHIVWRARGAVREESWRGLLGALDAGHPPASTGR